MLSESHGESRNVGQLERAISVAAGGALAAVGLRKRGVSGMALALVGAELTRRGISGHCRLYDAFGATTHTSTHGHRDDVTSRAATVNARRAIKVERRIHIARPSEDLYRLWRDFANLPRFMQHVESVQSIDSLHSHWVGRLPGGKQFEWDSEIVNDVEGSLIAWKTVGDPDIAHAGSVHFTALASGATEVRVVFDYEPPFARIMSGIASHLGLTPDAIVEGDLQRFKDFVESTAGWAAPGSD